MMILPNPAENTTKILQSNISSLLANDLTQLRTEASDLRRAAQEATLTSHRADRLEDILQRMASVDSDLRELRAVRVVSFHTTQRILAILAEARPIFDDCQLTFRAEMRWPCIPERSGRQCRAALLCARSSSAAESRSTSFYAPSPLAGVSYAARGNNLYY